MTSTAEERARVRSAVRHTARDLGSYAWPTASVAELVDGVCDWLAPASKAEEALVTAAVLQALDLPIGTADNHRVPISQVQRLGQQQEEVLVPLSADDREIVEHVKQAVREAQSPVGRIAAYNDVPLGKLALAVIALHELDEEDS